MLGGMYLSSVTVVYEHNKRQKCWVAQAAHSQVTARTFEALHKLVDTAMRSSGYEPHPIETIAPNRRRVFWTPTTSVQADILSSNS